jgi:predicted helicase
MRGIIESGIRNDPNDWSAEADNPKYILDLLLGIINVSIQREEIVEGLPEVKSE